MFEEMADRLRIRKLIQLERSESKNLFEEERCNLDELEKQWNADCDEREFKIDEEVSEILSQVIGRIAVRMLLLGGMNGARPRELRRYLPRYEASSIVTWTYHNGGFMMNGRLYLRR